MTADLKTAGREFVKSVITLYRTAKYFREKEILSNKLLESSVEAGALVSRLADCEDWQKSKLAASAAEHLDRALFILDVMQSEGIYSERRVKPVLNIAKPLKEAIKVFIVEEDPPMPVYYSAMPVAEADEQLLLHDNDGFNDVYSGELLQINPIKR